MREDCERRHRRSLRHTMLLLLAMAALLVYSGWVIAGWQGVWTSLLVAIVTLPFLQQMPTGLLLRAIGARLLLPHEAPLLYDILDLLCARAGIAQMPPLYWIRQRQPIAFSTGQNGTAAIVLARGLIEALDEREMRGVLAHEVVHLRNHDVALMQLAMMVEGLVRMLAQLAILFVFFGLLAGVGSAASLVSLALLAIAPTGVGLLQLALSRERESEADLEAAELTGDPRGLAAALAEIRRLDEALNAARFPGASLLRLPPLLRDHPATKERIRRLLEMPQLPDDDAASQEIFPKRRRA